MRKQRCRSIWVTKSGNKKMNSTRTKKPTWLRNILYKWCSVQQSALRKRPNNILRSLFRPALGLFQTGCVATLWRSLWPMQFLITFHESVCLGCCFFHLKFRCHCLDNNNTRGWRIAIVTSGMASISYKQQKNNFDLLLKRIFRFVFVGVCVFFFGSCVRHDILLPFFCFVQIVSLPGCKFRAHTGCEKLSAVDLLLANFRAGPVSSKKSNADSIILNVLHFLQLFRNVNGTKSTKEHRLSTASQGLAPIIPVHNMEHTP